MKTALDTNILSNIWSAQPMEAVIRATLRQLKEDGSLVLSPAVYAEALAHPNYTEAGVLHFLDVTGIAVDFTLPRAVWTEAGRRYSQYAVRRRRSQAEPPRRILADFLVGAHALLLADQLVTLHTAFYRTNFPELRLYPIGE